MDRGTIDKLGEAAREQAGYVTTAQAKRLGVSADLAALARRGDLRRVGHGIYALPGSFPGPREDAIAAWLRLVGGRLPWERSEPTAVASHATAADILGFGTFVPTSPAFTVRRRRFRPPDGSVRFYTAHLDPADWKWFRLPEGIELPVTTPARTIVDLAYAGEERGHVLDALDDARDAGLVTDDALAEAIGRRRRRRGRGSVGWLASSLGRQ